MKKVLFLILVSIILLLSFTSCDIITGILGKKISVLGDSISTYINITGGVAANTTIPL